MDEAPWRLIQFVSAFLENPAEREAVLGDLQENGGTRSLRGLLDLTGLVFRRQLRLWGAWNPWLAFALLFPWALLCGAPALSIGYALAHAAEWSKHNQHYSPWQYAGLVVAGSVALALWSWSAGFSMGKLAGTASLSVLLLLAVVSARGSIRDAHRVIQGGPVSMLLAATFGVFLVLAPVVLGVRYSLRGGRLRRPAALALTIVGIAAWGFLFAEDIRDPRTPWIIYFTGIVPAWPALYSIVRPAILPPKYFHGPCKP